MTTKGTYVGLRVLDPTRTSLVDHCLSSGIPVESSIFENRLHTTLIYSRTHCPNLVADDSLIFKCESDGYEIFRGPEGQLALVMLLKSDELLARHKFLMQEHSATYDFPIYRPHITLHYNYSDNSVMGIPKYSGPILLGLEYAEDLNLQWGKE